MRRILKICHLCKGYRRLAKNTKSVRVNETQILKNAVFCEKRSLQAGYRGFLCKMVSLKKQQIFEKWDHFENRPPVQTLNSSTSMVRVGSVEFKCPETCDKTFHIFARFLELFCGKKTARKNTNIREMGPFWKSAILRKAIDFAKWSVWVRNFKWTKNARKTILQRR